MSMDITVKINLDAETSRKLNAIINHHYNKIIKEMAEDNKKNDDGKRMPVIASDEES